MDEGIWTFLVMEPLKVFQKQIKLSMLPVTRLFF